MFEPGSNDLRDLGYSLRLHINFFMTSVARLGDTKHYGRFTQFPLYARALSLELAALAIIL